MYNLNYNQDNNLWHLMVKSRYIQREESTIIASCHYNKDKRRGKYRGGLHRDWADRPIAQFPNGVHFLDGAYKHVNLNFNMICKKCIKLETTNIEEFKSWLIVQKLKYL